MSGGCGGRGEYECWRKLVFPEVEVCEQGFEDAVAGVEEAGWARKKVTI